MDSFSKQLQSKALFVMTDGQLTTITIAATTTTTIYLFNNNTASVASRTK